MRIHTLRLLLTAWALAVTVSAVSTESESDSEGEEVALLTSPTVIKHGPLRYPLILQRKNQEGWVQLESMIDEKGKPYEIVVVDSAGHPEFERAAIRSMKRATYFPAEFEGQSVHGVAQLKVTFSLHDDAAAYFPAFRRAYLEVVQEIDSNDEPNAKEGLEELRERIKTIYEDSMFWTAQFLYDQKWGSPRQQLASVKRALANEVDARRMDERLFRQLVWAKLNLEVQFRHYREALEVISVLEETDGLSEDELARVRDIAGSIEGLIEADTQYLIEGEINKRGKWRNVLLRNQFGVVDVEGVIYEFELYCQKDKLRFRFEPEQEYRVEGARGVCNLWVVGKPETTFKLVQL